MSSEAGHMSNRHRGSSRCFTGLRTTHLPMLSLYLRLDRDEQDRSRLSPCWLPEKRTKRFRREVLRGGDSHRDLSVGGEFGLDGESEQCANEATLAERISFGQPSHSPLPDHVHCLDPL